MKLKDLLEREELFPTGAHRFFAVSLLYLLGACGALYFLLPHFFSSIPLPQNTDNHLGLTILWSHLDHLLGGELFSLYNLPFYYPYGWVMTAGTNIIAQSVLLLPLALLGVEAPYPYLNALLLFALVMDGWGLYTLARRFLRREAFALLAGLLFLLHPFRQNNYPHADLLYFFPTLFMAASLVRFFQERRRRDLALFFLFYALQSLFSLSLFFVDSLVLLLLFPLLLLLMPGEKVSPVLLTVLGLVFTVLVVGAVFWPYLGNPLRLVAGEERLGVGELIPSHYLYSTWFPLTFPFTRFPNRPLFLGFVAMGALALFFFRRIGSSPLRFLALPLFLALTLPVPLGFLMRFIPFSLLCDTAFTVAFLLLGICTLLAWKRTTPLERVLLLFLLLIFLIFFRGLYRWIPPEANPLILASHFSRFLMRLRGHKLVHLFVAFWLILSLKGAEEWRGRLGGRLLLVLLMVVELFPRPLRTGPLYYWDREVIHFYRSLPPPSGDGLLETPLFSGFGEENHYLPFTRFHRRHIVNALYGVGLTDSSSLLEGLALESPGDMVRVAGEGRVWERLREKGIQWLVFHRRMVEFKRKGPVADREWEEVERACLKALKEGRVEEVRRVGQKALALRVGWPGDRTRWSFPFPCYERRRRLVLNFLNPGGEGEVRILFDRLPAETFRVSPGSSLHTLSLPGKIGPKGIRIEIISSTPLHLLSPLSLSE